MGSGVDQLAAELAASDAARVEARQAAEAKRAAERGFVANLQLSLGMRVEKRRAGGAWSEGFVTSLEPLRITFDCSQGPAAWGRSAGGASAWGDSAEEVRRLSAERQGAVDEQRLDAAIDLWLARRGRKPSTRRRPSPRPDKPPPEAMPRHVCPSCHAEDGRGEDKPTTPRGECDKEFRRLMAMPSVAASCASADAAAGSDAARPVAPTEGWGLELRCPGFEDARSRLAPASSIPLLPSSAGGGQSGGVRVRAEWEPSGSSGWTTTPVAPSRARSPAVSPLKSPDNELGKAA